MHHALRLVAGFVAATVSITATAATTFIGPTPYLSEADIPAGFYGSGSPDALDNFEDGTLDFGITTLQGGAFGPSAITDSVDVDDGVIDGSGLAGTSWFSGSGPTGITFFFSGTLPTAAGVVWTDGAGTVLFEAFAAGGASLGTIGPAVVGDAFHNGATAEDRFFGVQSDGGISAIKISNSAGGIEVDHVQFGGVPEPATATLLAVLAPALLRRRRG